jgi:hypothetical protein
VTVDAGYIDRAVTIAGKLDEGRCIELGRKGEVYGDAPAWAQMDVTIYVAGYELGGASALDRRHIAASRPERLAKYYPIVWRASFDHEVEGLLRGRKPRFSTVAERSQRA